MDEAIRFFCYVSRRKKGKSKLCEHLLCVKPRLLEQSKDLDRDAAW